MRALLGFITALYLLTLARVHNEAEDSLQYLMDVAELDFAGQFVSQHLLFGPFNWIVFQVWRAGGYAGTAELPVQLLNVAAGSVSLMLLVLIARAMRLPRVYSLALVSCVAFSYGFWHYSVGCDTYILPIPFVLALVLVAIRTCGHDRAGYTQYGTIGALHAGAVCFSFLYILLAPVILIGFLRCRRRQTSLRQTGLYVATYLCAFMLTAVAAYWIGGSLSRGHPLNAVELIEFALGIVPAPAPTWTFPLLAVTGFSRSIVGGHWLMSLPATDALLSQLFANYVIVEEKFLVRDFAVWKVVLCVLSTVAGALSAIWILGGLLRSLRSKNTPDAAEAAPGRAFVLTFTGFGLLLFTTFITTWGPHNTEHWIALTPLLFLFVVTTLASRYSGARYAIPLIVFATSLLATNLVGSIYPATKRDNDLWYAANRALIETATRDDLILSNGGFINANTLNFFTDARVIDFLYIPDEPYRVLAEFEGLAVVDRVLVSSWLVHPPVATTSRRIIREDNWQARRIFEDNLENMEVVEKDDWQVIHSLAPGTLRSSLRRLAGETE